MATEADPTRTLSELETWLQSGSSEAAWWRQHSPAMGVRVSKHTREKKHATSGCGSLNSFTRAYVFTGHTLPTSDANVVREATQVGTGAVFAVKCVPRNADADAVVRNEISMLRRLSHVGIVSLCAAYEERDYSYLVMVPVGGGDLFDRLSVKTHLEESTCQRLVKQLLVAVEYCHSQGIVHHDLRPENILMINRDDDVSIKLTGFGMAASVASPRERSLTCMRGTPGYIAPEVISGEHHGCAVDVWSLGVITYIVLCGSPPIYGDNDAEILAKTKVARVEYVSPLWEGVSFEAKDFITKAMTRSQLERWSVTQLLAHSWLCGNG